MKKVIALSALLLASGLVSAQQSGFYIGASIGSATVDIEDGAASALTQLGITNVSGNIDDTDFSYKLFGGYKINKNFAVEGGYANLGKFTTNASGTALGQTLSASGDVKSYAIFLDAVGILPASEEFSVFGKLGFAYTDTTASASASLAGFSASSSESAGQWVPKLGLGAQYYVTKAVALRAEYEYYFNVGDENTTGQSDVQVFSAGITFGF
jgi:OOP family OmpA-OmpF porin